MKRVEAPSSTSSTSQNQPSSISPAVVSVATEPSSSSGTSISSTQQTAGLGTPILPSSSSSSSFVLRTSPLLPSLSSVLKNAQLPSLPVPTIQSQPVSLRSLSSSESAGTAVNISTAPVMQTSSSSSSSSSSSIVRVRRDFSSKDGKAEKKESIPFRPLEIKCPVQTLQDDYEYLGAKTKEQLRAEGDVITQDTIETWKVKGRDGQVIIKKSYAYPWLLTVELACVNFLAALQPKLQPPARRVLDKERKKEYLAVTKIIQKNLLKEHLMTNTPDFFKKIQTGQVKYFFKLLIYSMYLMEIDAKNYNFWLVEDGGGLSLIRIDMGSALHSHYDPIDCNFKITPKDILNAPLTEFYHWHHLMGVFLNGQQAFIGDPEEKVHPTKEGIEALIYSLNARNEIFDTILELALMPEEWLLAFCCAQTSDINEQQLLYKTLGRKSFQDQPIKIIYVGDYKSETDIYYLVPEGIPGSKMEWTVYRKENNVECGKINSAKIKNALAVLNNVDEKTYNSDGIKIKEFVSNALNDPSFIKELTVAIKKYEEIVTGRKSLILGLLSKIYRLTGSETNPLKSFFSNYLHSAQAKAVNDQLFKNLSSYSYSDDLTIASQNLDCLAGLKDHSILDALRTAIPKRVSRRTKTPQGQSTSLPEIRSVSRHLSRPFEARVRQQVVPGGSSLSTVTPPPASHPTVAQPVPISITQPGLQPSGSATSSRYLHAPEPVMQSYPIVYTPIVLAPGHILHVDSIGIKPFIHLPHGGLLLVTNFILPQLQPPQPIPMGSYLTPNPPVGSHLSGAPAPIPSTISSGSIHSQTTSVRPNLPVSLSSTPTPSITVPSTPMIQSAPVVSHPQAVPVSVAPLPTAHPTPQLVSQPPRVTAPGSGSVSSSQVPVSQVPSIPPLPLSSLTNPQTNIGRSHVPTSSSSSSSSSSTLALTRLGGPSVGRTAGTQPPQSSGVGSSISSSSPLRVVSGASSGALLVGSRHVTTRRASRSGAAQPQDPPPQVSTVSSQPNQRPAPTRNNLVKVTSSSTRCVIS